MIDLCGFVIFVERLGRLAQIALSCKLQSKQISKKYPQAQDPIILIGELAKAVNLHTNFGVAHHIITPKLELHLRGYGCKRLNLIESF